MLDNMFVGRPPGNYDRLLDFSRAVTGNLFFVPSATFLDNVGERCRRPPKSNAANASSAAPPEPSHRLRDGSLGIGSLKGDPSHE